MFLLYAYLWFGGISGLVFTTWIFCIWFYGTDGFAKDVKSLPIYAKFLFHIVVFIMGFMPIINTMTWHELIMDERKLKWNIFS